MYLSRNMDEPSCEKKVPKSRFITEHVIILVKE